VHCPALSRYQIVGCDLSTSGLACMGVLRLCMEVGGGG